MKKLNIVLTVVLILCLTSGTSWAKAFMNVFYSPDSGYLKVGGELVIEPNFESLSLLVFPNAQITEFWAEGLQTYQLDRNTEGTLVTFSLTELKKETTLALSYEGFLAPQGEQVKLDQSTLWFPKFSFPVKTTLAGPTLPPNWGIVAQSLNNNYPELLLARQTPDSKLQFAEQDLQLDLEAPIDLVPAKAEFLSKIQIQVTRLINHLNSRNQEGLKAIIAEHLLQEGLANYLVSVPETFGTLTSEFLSTPSYAEEPFQLVLNTTKGPRFVATMGWQEIDQKMILVDFSLAPLGQTAPPVVEESLFNFVSFLHTAAKAGDRESLQSVLNPSNIAEQVLDFLTSLSTTHPWKIKYTTLEPLSITVLVTHSSEARLLLNLGLSFDEENWLIDTLDVIPLR